MKPGTRTPIVGGNWKMNLLFDEAQRLSSELRGRLGSHRGAQVVIFPPYPYLAPVAAKMRDSAVAVGAQDVHTHVKGAYTSGVSAKMVRSIGCTHALIGHSERRAHFRDGDPVVADKLKAALDADLVPVLCVGESLAERQSGQTFDVLERQLRSALSAHDASVLSRLVLAYEPVWAIGTGQTATPQQAQDVHAWVRGKVAGHFGAAFGASLRIQYGGSVTADNAATLMSQDDVDGALVGGASLDCGGFARIVMASSAR